jgi:hypothetical protein
MRKPSGKVPDTANVRGDLIGFEQPISKNRALLVVFASLRISENFSETSTSMANLRMNVLQVFTNRSIWCLRAESAVARSIETSRRLGIA